MNKQDLIDFVVDKTKLSKKDSGNAIDAIFEGIITGLAKDKEARFLGFGSFSVLASPSRKGRNPRTGEELTIAASKRPTFKPGKEFKDVINSSK